MKVSAEKKSRDLRQNALVFASKHQDVFLKDLVILKILLDVLLTNLSFRVILDMKTF